jgi:hypothetical protein
MTGLTLTCEDSLSMRMTDFQGCLLQFPTVVFLRSRRLTLDYQWYRHH